MTVVSDHVDGFDILSEETLLNAYYEVVQSWERNLRIYEVKLPPYETASGLWLAILWLNRSREIHKQAIAKVVGHYRPGLGRDQQVRHLKEDGWNDVSGRKGWHKIDFGYPLPAHLYRLRRSHASLDTALGRY